MTGDNTLYPSEVITYCHSKITNVCGELCAMRLLFCYYFYPELKQRTLLNFRKNFSSTPTFDCINVRTTTVTF